ncbi:MAG: hypothetical protein NZ529_10845, partial [Cytophagaceae bacterium]|nr:hypothetical protein [Cytophagaceae bacterium]MDW8457282.1 hypothetical protein [Cytophagaceae bacterium]
MKSPIIILYFLPCLLYANLVKINDTKEDNFLIGTILEVMEDTSGKLTIDDVSSPQYSKAFRPNLKRGKSAPYIEKPG